MGRRPYPPDLWLLLSQVGVISDPAIICISLGAFLVVDDLLYRWGVFRFHEPAKIKGIRIHHTYFGVALILLGILICYFKGWQLIV